MNQRSRLIFYPILILAICLRFWAINSQSLWLDELWAIEIACGHDADHQLLPVGVILNHPPDLTGLASAAPVWRIWIGMDRVTSPPEYYLLLRFWMMIFGQRETTLRSLSAVFSILAIGVFFLAFQSSAGPEPALWATIMFAIAEPQIHDAQDTRPYTLLIFEAVMAAFAIIKIAATGPSLRRSIAMSILMLCLILTHYFAIAAIIAIGGYAFIGTSGAPRKNILLCVGIVVIVFAVVWGPMMWRQVPMFSTADRAAAFLHDKSPDHFRQILWHLLAMPMSMLCDIRPIPRWYAIGGLWYLLMAYLVFRRRLHLLWPILYVSVVSLLAILDLAHSTQHLAYIRYAMLSSLPVYAVLAGLIKTNPMLGRTVCAGAVLFCALSLPRAYSPHNEDFRSFGAAINASTQKDDLIVFAGPADTYAPQILYLAASYYSWPLRGPAVLIQSPAKPGLMAQLNSRKTLWLAADPTIRTVTQWLPGYHVVAGKDWPEVGCLLEMERDP